jgi:TP901 family phage tail tape measure protein
VTQFNIVTKIDAGGVRSGRREVEGELNALERSARSLKGELLGALGGAAVGAAVAQTVASAKALSASLAEISTQVDTTKFSIAALRDVAFEQANAFATTPFEQTKALYEIISAGAESSAAAIETLNSANELATGGITEVAVAADLLTSVINSYGDEVGSAREISDALFIAVRNGKTTMSELAATLGRVAPLAAQTGVSFDELVGATAALTKGGIQTSEAVIGVRAILAAVAKPSQEASEAAAKLGLEFNTAAIEAKGLQGFLADVTAKTGGSTDALSILFGGVEAIIPALALAGEAGRSFATTMADLAQKAGATEQAVEKIRSGPAFQADQLFANITNGAVRLALVLLDELGPSLRFVNDNFDEIVGVVAASGAAYLTYSGVMLLVNSRLAIQVALVATTAARFGILTAAQIAASLAAGGLATATNILTAAIARNPVGIFAVALAGVAGALAFSAITANDAANAQNTFASATALSEAATRDSAEAIEKATNATRAERAETIAAARAAIAKANDDITAAEAAIKRARAELLLKQALEQRVTQAASDSGIFGGESAGFGFLVAQEGARAAAVANDNLTASIKRLDDAQNALGIRQRSLRGLESATGAADFKPVNLGDDPKSPKAKKASNDNERNFADIKRELEDEVKLVREVGLAREILQAKIAAERDLKRSLSGVENETIARLIGEGKAIEQLRSFREDIIKPLDEERELLLQVGVEREIRSAQLRAQADLQRDLTKAESDEIAAKVANNSFVADQINLLNQIQAPLENYRRDIEALNGLLSVGSITQEQFNNALAQSPLQRDLRDLDQDIVDPGQRLAAEIAQIEIEAQTKLEVAKRGYAAELLAQNISEEAKLAAERRYQQRVGLIRDQEELRRQGVQRQRRLIEIGAAQSTFETLAELTEGFAGKQSAAYKVLFGISKAFAIATSIINIQQAISEALKLPFPTNLPAIATIAAQAANIVSSISAVTLSFANGGIVQGLGGSRSDDQLARVSSGEFIVNARSTRENLPALERINRGEPLAANNNDRAEPSSSIIIEQIVVQVESTGNADQDGQAIGVAIEKQLRQIVISEIRTQSRGGGALTRTNQSVLAG